MFPILKEWATSDNRWTHRTAAVTLIIPARKGLFLNDIFQIATTLFHDEDDLVQKGPQLIYLCIMATDAAFQRMCIPYSCFTSSITNVLSREPRLSIVPSTLRINSW